ncbi:MAG: dihydrodipicolinate synthase family protein [Candidatus Cyclobacteriaceae bacterium M3_2C_046]
MDKLPSGLWPVMLTPFKTDSTVDYDALARLTDFYQNAGANGLFANCLSSEMFQLTAQERILITQTVLKKVNQQIPVIATGTFTSDLKENADFIKQLYDTGVKAVVVNTNQLVDSSASEEDLKGKIELLLRHTESIPLGLYECPVPYKRLLSPSMVQWLAQTTRFYYLKDTSCNLDQIKAKLSASENSPLGLYNANTPTGVSSLQAGARGISPIGANFYPELFRFQLDHMNQTEKSEVINAQLTLMDDVIHQHYPWSAKYFLQNRGLKLQQVTRTPVSSPEKQFYLKLKALKYLLEDYARNLAFPLII